MIEAAGEPQESRRSEAWRLPVLDRLSGALALVLLAVLAYHFPNFLGRHPNVFCNCLHLHDILFLLGVRIVRFE